MRWIVVEVRQTEKFAKWFRGLTDHQARARVLARVRRLSLGNFGDVKPVGEGISELRIFCGPGYRVYFVQRDAVVLLTGGTKGTQSKDIAEALRIAKEEVR